MPSVNPGPATSSVVNTQPIVGSFDNSGNLLQAYGPNGVAIPLSASGTQGVTNGSDAPAGYVGEYLTASAVSTTVSLTTATPANAITLSLTAGDWDVQGIGVFQTATNTSVTNTQVGLSTTTATFGSDGSYTRDNFAAVVPGAIEWRDSSTPVLRISLAATTTVYLVVQSAFTVSTQTAGGVIRARRVR